MKEFKSWYSINWKKFEKGSDRLSPNYKTYRDKGFKSKECRDRGVKLDDFWWTSTYLAFAAFKAGQSHK